MAERAKRAVAITDASGRLIRLGPNEVELSQVPTAISYSTALPGGFDSADVTLPRPKGVSALDAKSLERAFLRIYNASTNQTLYEGQIVGLPQTGANEIELQTQGYSKALENRTARMVFYDRDLSKWSSMPTNRQIQTYAVPGVTVIGSQGLEWDRNLGMPAVTLSFQEPWGGPTVEAWYDAQGLNVAGLDYAWNRGVINSADTHWFWKAILTDIDHYGTEDITANLRAAGPGSGTLTATGTRHFAYVQMYYDIAAAGNTEWKLFWTLAAPFGDHGITLRGSVSTPNTGRGLYASDVAAYIVSQWAPSLSYTTGTNGSIEPTTFAIPHLVFYDETTPAEMLSQIATLGSSGIYPLDYGVYDNRQFFMRSPGTYGNTWRLRLDEGVTSSSQGSDVTSHINGITVSYSDGSGLTHTVGPIGSSAEATSASLTDTSPTNPANNDNQPHWGQIEAGITTQAGAIIIGGLAMARANDRSWRGDITVPLGSARTDGGQLDTGLIRSGDYIVIEDDPDGDTRPRRVIQTQTSDSVQASVGAPPDHLDSILARLSTVLTGNL